jgi:predicted nucleic acid-binding protein
VIFVDTSAWFAGCVPTDANHKAASGLLRSRRSRFVTTDFVIDELLTLLKARGEFKRALDIGSQLFGGVAARIEWVEQADVLEAWQVFVSHRDKAWSFTDCVSLVVMERLGIAQSFAFDEHFKQFGTVTVVP